MSKTTYIGKKVARDDGVAKATGALRFYTDYPSEGMLQGAILRSAYAHARILKIDTSAAKAMPGVVDVLTGADVPEKNLFGICALDQPVLSLDKVRFTGDPVALVLAEDIETAKAALGAIKVDYEPLPVIETAEQALAADAEQIHADGNVSTQYEFANGNVEDYFTDDYVVAEHTYTTPYQEHVCMEVEGGFAKPTDDGGVELFCGAQYGHQDRWQLELILGLPPEKIIVHTSPVGGGFGRKDDMLIQPLLALAAFKTKRPVHICLDREDSFLFGPKRIPFTIHMKTSADRDGKLMAHQVNLALDLGPYAGIGAAVFHFGFENCCGPYLYKAVDVKAVSFFSNNTHCGAFRGFGSNQVHFAVESQIDELSEKLGMDPVELRKKNLTQTGGKLNFGQSHAGSDGLKHSVDLLGKSKLWKNREQFKAKAAHPHLKRGVGVAVCQHGNGLGNGMKDGGEARIALCDDGTFELYVNYEDIGQGSITSLHMIAAEYLKVPEDQITIINGNTGICPDAGPATASRSTFIGGNAIISAADALLKEMTAELESRGMRFELARGGANLDGKFKSWQDIAAMIPEASRVGQAESLMPTTDVKMNIGIHYVLSHVSQVVGVEVNTLTGKVDVLETEILPAAGTVINRLGYEGQAEGGAVMALGFALMEEFRVNAEKFPLTRNLQTYLIPTVRDMPKITVTPVEDKDKFGPYGAKGLGEPVSVPGTPAITNAIYDAVGVRVYDLPATPEKILLALESA